MDPELAELASTAGLTLVKLMTTDLWGRAKSAAAALFGRGSPDDESEAADQLERSRGELTAASRAGDDLTATELAEQWGRRVRWLLNSDPSAIVQLRALLAEFESQLPSDDRQQSIRMKATARDSAKIYMAGRDQHLS